MRRKKIFTVAVSILCFSAFAEAQARRNSKSDPCLGLGNPHIMRVTPKALKDSATHSVDLQLPKNCRCDGKVLVRILVAEDGTVKCAKYKKGHPLLKKAALEAAREWKFKPITLSGVLVTYYGDLEFDVSEQTGKL
jgi:TonB family protein